MSFNPFDTTGPSLLGKILSPQKTKSEEEKRAPEEKWAIHPVAEHISDIHLFLKEYRHSMDDIPMVRINYGEKSLLVYEATKEEVALLDKKNKELFAAYHKESTTKKTPWIMSVDCGIGKQDLHKAWSTALFRRPPPPKKKYLP